MRHTDEAVGDWGFHESRTIITRRKALGAGAALAAAGFVGLDADVAEAGPTKRSLNLYNPRTREKLQVVYRVGNRYSRNGMRKINHIMRDWRTDEARKMDPRVIDYLYSIKRWLGVTKPIHIVSGYRSPSTNAMLARKSGGVARNSYHVKGMAIDLKIPNYSVRSISRAAQAMKIGGVGRYSRSNFVHIDSAEYRVWGR